MLFCQYKNIFGKPNTGLHSVRLFGVAVYDVVGTIIIAMILSFAFKWNFLLTLLITFIIAELLHVMFCVNTAFVNNVLGIRFD